MKITEDSIRQLEHELIAAIKANDIAFLDRVLHNDLRFIAPNGEVITKDVDLASHKARSMVVDRLVPMIEDIKITDDTAVVIIVYETEGKMLGNPIQGRFRYLRVWKVFPDSPKVIAGSCFKL